MFNIGAGEWLLLAVLGVILVGPDRLPRVASDGAKLLRRFKELTSAATHELRENLGPGFEDLNVTDLHPKRFIMKTINEGVESAVPMNELREIRDIAKEAKIDPDLL
jgi:sec-independent protein translocase protein TatB